MREYKYISIYLTDIGYFIPHPLLKGIHQYCINVCDILWYVKMDILILVKTP